MDSGKTIIFKKGFSTPLPLVSTCCRGRTCYDGNGIVRESTRSGKEGEGPETYPAANLVAEQEGRNVVFVPSVLVLD